MQVSNQALASGIRVQPVQFFGEAGLEGIDGDRGIVGGLGSLKRAVECV